MATAGSALEVNTQARFEAFDSLSSYLLGISGDEFIRRWKAEEFGPDPDAIPGVMEVAFLMPAAEAQAGFVAGQHTF